jgi:hypothetical protein
VQGDGCNNQSAPNANKQGKRRATPCAHTVIGSRELRHTSPPRAQHRGVGVVGNSPKARRRRIVSWTFR